MATEQVPALPNATDLANLSQPVAILFLVAIIVVAVLVYLGPGLRDRLSPKKPDAAPSPSAVVASSPVAASAVEANNEFVDRYVSSLERRVADLERDNKSLRDEVEDLRDQLTRMRLRRDRDAGY